MVCHSMDSPPSAPFTSGTVLTRRAVVFAPWGSDGGLGGTRLSSSGFLPMPECNDDTPGLELPLVAVCIGLSVAGGTTRLGNGGGGGGGSRLGCNRGLLCVVTAVLDSESTLSCLRPEDDMVPFSLGDVRPDSTSCPSPSALSDGDAPPPPPVPVLGSGLGAPKRNESLI